MAYYAARYPYGSNTVCNNYNPPTIYRFKLKTWRDEFVKTRGFREGSNPCTESITALEKRRLDRFRTRLYHVVDRTEDGRFLAVNDDTSEPWTIK